MSRSDYAHWNEEQDRVWWEEEGKHVEEDRFDADEDWRDEPPPDDDVEHLTLEDCKRDSCFSQKDDSSPWICDLCGETIPPEVVTW